MQTQPAVEYQLRYKRHSRIHSIEELSKPPVDNRYGRGFHTCVTNLTELAGPHSSFHDMPAHLAISEDEDVEKACARALHSVGA